MADKIISFNSDESLEIIRRKELDELLLETEHGNIIIKKIDWPNNTLGRLQAIEAILINITNNILRHQTELLNSISNLQEERAIYVAKITRLAAKAKEHGISSVKDEVDKDTLAIVAEELLHEEKNVEDPLLENQPEDEYLIARHKTARAEIIKAPRMNAVYNKYKNVVPNIADHIMSCDVVP
jgi:hypothetical protein